MRIGTGFFDLIQKTSDNENDIMLEKKQPLFDDDSLHKPFSFDVDPRFAPSLDATT